MYARTLYVVFSCMSLLLLASCETIFVNEQYNVTPQWVKHPASERQCITYEFLNIEQALSELHRAEITVLSSKTVQFPVCKACTCPVGLEFHAMINEEDVPKAIQIGWTQVPADSLGADSNF